MKTASVLKFPVKLGRSFGDSGFTSVSGLEGIIAPSNLSLRPTLNIPLSPLASHVDICERTFVYESGTASIISLLTFNSDGIIHKAYPVVDPQQDVPESVQIQLGRTLPCPHPVSPVTLSSVKVCDSIIYGLSTDGRLLCSTYVAPTFQISHFDWEMCAPFASPDGCVDSSLGKGRIVEFHPLPQRCLVILDNGAVFVYGLLKSYELLKPALPLLRRPSPPSSAWATALAQFPSNPSAGMPKIGWIELTNSATFPSPLFVSEFCRKIEQSAGRYGLFGQHKITRYFPAARAFVSDSGIVFLDTVHYDGENKQRESSPARRFITAVDPEIFNGERICDIFFDGCFVFKSTTNKLFITQAVNDPPLELPRELFAYNLPSEAHERYNEGREFLRALYAAVLCEKMRERQIPPLPYPVASAVVAGGYYFMHSVDGKVHCMSLENQQFQDITPFIFATDRGPSSDKSDLSQTSPLKGPPSSLQTELTKVSWMTFFKGAMFFGKASF